MIVERPGLERRVLAALDAGRIPVVLGGCGTGRTSLLLRLQRLLGPSKSHYLDLAAVASTPERCLTITRRTSHLPAMTDDGPPASARAAFDGLLALLDGRHSPDGAPFTWCIDEILDVRTFENFPGLRHVQREIVARLATSHNRFVLASRFTARAHRLLRDAPAEFEVVHVPPFDAAETQVLAGARAGRPPVWPADTPAAVAALAGGRAGYVALLLEMLDAMRPSPDPVAAMAALFAPGGRLTSRCRESYEFRLHRARGYGALKAILAVLADDEPLNLTEIAQHLRRTPGSTKDYLSWLEDVDLVTVSGKRYTFEDPLLRLYVRLYGRATPPADGAIADEIGAYARLRLPRGSESRAPVADGGATTAPAGSGIIEID